MAKPDKNTQEMTMAGLSRKQFMLELWRYGGKVLFDTEESDARDFPSPEKLKASLENGKVLVMLGKQYFGITGDHMQAHAALTFNGWEYLTTNYLTVRLLVEISWEQIPKFLLKPV